ncbi:hypothetical protein HYG81_21465 (plasmid) [Natrinema zhouii]|uniref:hypothetical protein n=1 Tax=Natrinema zhouii TaxID=1710539 RepID=UPI001CFFDAE5|nr:hypothetical protein [Natrinema zhouii]UHQ98146.1 hypothetical protein HYG81_21465 [Natrinema zhouii]
MKDPENVGIQLIEAVQKLKEENEFERVEIRDEDKIIAHTSSGERTQVDVDSLDTTKREKTVGSSKPASTPTMSEASSY